MLKKMTQDTPQQRMFSELFVGTLIYVVVLGFFNDYTQIVSVKSFSYLFCASIVLEVLTYVTTWLKGSIVRWFKETRKALMVFGVWLVMFVSKFIFVGAVDVIFGDAVNIHGYFGILAVVLCVTLAMKLASYTYKKLGSTDSKL